MAELRKALAELPNALKLEAGSRVVAAANQAQADLLARYPTGETGNLRRGLRVRAKPAGSRFGAAMEVRSTAHHAHLFEFGTKVRQTKKGANRGFMPAADLFVPIMQRARIRLYLELEDVIREQGLEVRKS